MNSTQKLLFTILLSLIFSATSSAHAWPGHKDSAPDTVRAKKTVLASPGNSLPPANVTIPYEKYKLKNGLIVILSRDQRLPIVAVNVWYRVGPKDEKPGMTGFAHLFEHMMFEGSKHVKSRDHHKLLDAAGGTDVNGITGYDGTDYFETIPSNQLELALWLESDRMGFLDQSLDNDKLSKQRDVVRNESREQEAHPYDLVQKAISRTLFEKGHPYYASVIGSHADIESARLSDVQQFFRQYYSPNNASLVIAGDFDPTKAKELVEKYFGSLPPGPPRSDVKIETAAITAERRISVTDRVTLPAVCLTWITPPIYKQGDIEANLIAHILYRRLYTKLIYGRKIAQDISVTNSGHQLASVFRVTVSARPNVKLEDLEVAIDNEIASFLAHGGATKRQLQSASNTIKTQTLRDWQSIGGSNGRAARLNKYNAFTGDPGYLELVLKRYNAISQADLNKFANQYLQKQSRVVAYALPGVKVVDDGPRSAEKDESVQTIFSADAESWRTLQPKSELSQPTNFPKPECFKLENGFTVQVLENHELPIVSAQLTVQEITGLDVKFKPGLAYITALEFRVPTRKLSSLPVFDSGTNADTRVEDNAIKMTFDVPTQNLDRVLAMFSYMALHPNFFRRDLKERLRLRLTELTREKDNTNAVADRVKLAAVYGVADAYGFPLSGNIASMKSISLNDVKGLWRETFVPDACNLVIAGDITLNHARELSEKYFGSWTGTRKLQKPVERDQPLTRALYIVDQPGASQSTLLLVGRGPELGSQDHFAAHVMNCILGELSSSRLNMNLRQKNGYCYSARSFFEYNPGACMFTAHAKVRQDATGLAVAQLLEIIENISKESLSSEELLNAKEHLKLSLVGSFGTSSAMASELSDLFIYNLPGDYFQTMLAKIDGINQSDVTRVAKKYLNQKNMVLIVAGDKRKIETELKSLNFEKFVELNSDGSSSP